MDIFKVTSKWCLIKIIISLLFGLILALYLTPKSHNFNQIAAKYAINFFENHFDCDASFTINQINLFHGTCVLHDVLVKPKNRFDQTWQWRCQKLECQIDWFVFFTKRILKTKLRLEQLDVRTIYCPKTYHLAITAHLQQLLFAPSAMCIALDNIDIKQGLLHIVDQQQDRKLTLSWHSQTTLLEDSLKTNFYLKNSDLKIHDQIYFNQLTGPIQVNFSLTNINQINANGDLHFALPGLDPNDQYFLKFKYENQKVICKLTSLNGTIDLTTNIYCPTNLKQDWQIDAKGLLSSFTSNHLITFQAQTDLSSGLNGNCQIENLGKVKFIRQNNLWTGELILQNNNLVLPIFWQLDEQIGQIDSSCDLKLVHPWLPENLQSLLTCEGTLIISSNLKDHNLNCKIKLLNGNLLIPKIYTVIYDLNGSIDFNLKNKLLKISNTSISLHQGKIEIPCATMHWSDNYLPDYIYLPAILTNCVINYDKQLIGNLNGRILYQKNLNLTDCLTGFVALEQAVCKYNLLSDDFINLFNQASSPTNFILNPTLDLNFFTLAPIKIQSEPLQTSVTAKLQITKKILNPLVIGEIKIVGGKINFPYKPLYITQGNIHFTAEQPHDAIINLHAKNRIKLHNISMQINGPLKNPQIDLESFPDLTSEQIGALLLVGSENSSLNHSMPNIIMQNLNQAVLGLNHVKFIPSFSDEAGHQGLTGAVEIDVDDRLHASIKKNFSAQQDTKFEVDYAVTDNFSIRGIKDERGDLGGEIEIRLRI